MLPQIILVFPNRNSTFCSCCVDTLDPVGQGSLYWVLVKGFNLRYHIKETKLFTIDPYYGNLSCLRIQSDTGALIDFNRVLVYSIL